MEGANPWKISKALIEDYFPGTRKPGKQSPFSGKLPSVQRCWGGQPSSKVSLPEWWFFLYAPSRQST